MTEFLSIIGTGELKVHDSKMESSECEKYLGDFITSDGKLKVNIDNRRAKGYGLAAEILAILDEVPLGKHRIEIGLILRQAMLVNGMLYNSEAWHCLSESDIKSLEKVDEYLLRNLTKAHSKTPLEFLYLETGTMPLSFIISSRRLNFFHNIIRRDKNELIYRIYKAQMESPLPGDWINLLKSDFNLIELPFNEEKIKNMKPKIFKKLIKAKIKCAALKYLKEIQSEHSKIKLISYPKLEMQKYLSSKEFNNEQVNLLAALRSRMVDVKCNF